MDGSSAREDRTNPTDPIRAEVERTLREALGWMGVTQQRAGRRVRRCVATGVHRALAPWRLAASIAGLAIGRVVSPAETEPVGGTTAAGGAPPPAPNSPDGDEPAIAPDIGGEPASETAATDVAEAAVAAAALDEAAGSLPIGEYESLAASHVVARLPALTPEELRAVRAFETANRGRRTVLGKIDQLLAGG